MKVALRAATMDDAEMVFTWRNDPFIVSRGSRRNTVAQAEHIEWFTKTVTGKDRKMFIVEVDGNPAGQVRFDRSDERSCVVSAYLLEQFTGRGLGVEAIRMGCRAIADEWNPEAIVACVRNDNEQGRAAFAKAGFEETMPDSGCPAGHYTFVYTRR